MYYMYGPNGNVVYINNIVYVNGEPEATAQEYYQQARTIAEAAPKLDKTAAEKVEWLPLGMFAYIPEGAEDATCYLQLALSREGIIGGTYFNEMTNSSRPIEGSVDKETQRATWRFADGRNQEFVMETGIYNLTKDNASTILHFGPNKYQQGILVRLEAPEDIDLE